MLSRRSRIYKSINFSEIFSVTLCLCSDILADSPLPFYDYIINPANESLVGTKQAYFPVGGPVPPLPKDGKILSSSKWGGMDAGENMLYSVQVLDGLIHEASGLKLLEYLQGLPPMSPFTDAVGQTIRCREGKAIISPSFGSLKKYFGGIIHTVPPFFSDPLWERKLEDCYLNSFQLAWDNESVSYKDFSNSNGISVASVLLGSGCRGINSNEASRIASVACSTYNNYLQNRNIRLKHNGRRILHFVLREEEQCQLLSDHIFTSSGLSN